ncbi:MAG: carbohydrate ABC transporter permease [Spirochaetales bacterium]|nr:carbohydrate ABC transporter permease [Spirochaetales bacterium]
MKFRFRTLQRIAVIALLSIGALIYFVPVLWTVTTSFKTPKEIMTVPPTILPGSFTYLGNYEEVFDRAKFGRFLMNTFLLGVSAVCVSLVVASMAGYGFAKFRFPLREVFFFAVIGVLMVPFHSVAVPLFVYLERINLVDTFLGLLLPLVISAFGVLLMREGIASIPDDYIDAARIDGCSELRIFWTVVMPMIKPALAALAIIKFMWTWNEFFWPLLVITTPAKAVVTLGISYFTNFHFKEYHLIMAAATLSMLPLFLLFAILRRWMIEALTGTGLKA